MWSGQRPDQPASAKGQSAWLVGLLVLWELASRQHWVNPLIVPPISKVGARILSGLAEGPLALQLLQSIALVLAGLAVGSLIGLMLASLDYFVRPLRAPIAMLNAILHPLPGVALLPVILSIAGLGLPAVFLVILHAIVWSSYLSFAAGFRAVATELIDVAHNLGATAWQVLIHVLLPLSGPHLAAGLKIGWSRGWRALISAEMIFSAIGSLGGIGWYLFERRAFMDITGVYAGIVLIIVTGFVMENWLFRKGLPGQSQSD
jgi:NitT/TauT family transport system permease protein